MREYSFDFSPLDDTRSRVRYTDCQGRMREFTAHVRDQFLRRSQPTMSAAASDLIDLAVAVYTADRLSPREWDRPCALRIRLPVRLPERLADTMSTDLLARLLHWYTEDRWSFEFTRRTGLERVAGRQGQLLGATSAAPAEVALWSGGVDALAGLLSRLSEAGATRTFSLVGVGTGTNVQHRQAGLFDELGALADRWHLDRQRLRGVPVVISHRGIGDLETDADMRTRGFVFALIGAACALAEGSRELMAYENGIGAINLPWRPAEIGLDLARGVHPRSLLLLGEFLSHVLGEPFAVRNPFVFRTKGELCATLVANRAGDLAPSTSSCDRPHRLAGRPQCGYCTSCLLRRQGFRVSGIDDTTPYAIAAAGWHPKGRAGRELLAWTAMGQQAASIRGCLASPDPWRALGSTLAGLAEAAHVLATLGGESPASVRCNLLTLYDRHAREWEAVGAYIKPGASAGIR